MHHYLSQSFHFIEVEVNWASAWHSHFYWQYSERKRGNLGNFFIFNNCNSFEHASGRIILLKPRSQATIKTLLIFKGIWMHYSSVFTFQTYHSACVYVEFTQNHSVWNKNKTHTEYFLQKSFFLENMYMLQEQRVKPAYHSCCPGGNIHRPARLRCWSAGSCDPTSWPPPLWPLRHNFELAEAPWQCSTSPGPLGPVGGCTAPADRPLFRQDIKQNQSQFYWF